jgi:hypothetical protein
MNMKKLILLFALMPWALFGATEPINLNSNTGVVKKTSSGVGEAGKPFDFGAVAVRGTPHSITLYVDGAGSVLTTGTKNPFKSPYAGTLKGWTLMCKPSGSVTVDIFRAADGAGLPTVSIVGGGGTKPAVSSNVENSSTSFTGWTSIALAQFDNLAIDLSGISTVTYVELTLYFQ